MSENFEFFLNEDQTPATELLKQKRRQEYAKAKAEKAADKSKNQKQKRDEKLARQAVRDESLWATLTTASELDPSDD